MQTDLERLIDDLNHLVQGMVFQQRDLQMDIRRLATAAKEIADDGEVQVELIGDYFSAEIARLMSLIKALETELRG
jgi:adenylylsulfate kinase-like enzyme